MNRLEKSFPWLRLPLISNAPMSGVATSKLAVAVTKAGGMGQIGFTGSPFAMEQELIAAKSQLADFVAAHEGLNTLPIGIGIIVQSKPHSLWSSLLARYKPAMIWLSFGTAEQSQAWTEAVRSASPTTKVWIQTGSVAAALEAAKLCSPDALVLQGTDAGGHGTANAASIVSLIPEVADALEQQQPHSAITLLAAGGISDGRSAAAALALGADGVVMGTRFLGAREAMLDPEVRQEVFDAVDGGDATVRSRIWDDIWGANAWPRAFDGRCLKNAMWRNLQGGMGVDGVRRAFRDDCRKAETQHVDARDLSTVWAGTGVGFVRGLEDAADIVERVRKDTVNRLQALSLLRFNCGEDAKVCEA